MSSIVKQFRALKDIRPISNTYYFSGQKFASSIFNDCVRCADDEKLLEMLRKHAFTFVNALQNFSPEMLLEWRAFLAELVNDVIEVESAIFDIGGVSSWADESRQLLMHTRLGKRASFYVLRRLIMDGIDRLPIVASFASDCKNIVAVGMTLPNITRNLIEKNSAVTNVILWLNLVEIYTRQYQGRALYHREKYPELIAHLAKYKCTSKDQLQTWNNKPTDRASVLHDYVLYFLERVKYADLHLAATFLCDNIKVFYEFDRQCGTNRLSSMFRQALGLAAMTLKEEKEMNSKIQQTAKRAVSADLGRKLGDLLKMPPAINDRAIENDIDELIANLKQAREQLAQMRDVAAKLRATINKSKKLIADWEC